MVYYHIIILYSIILHYRPDAVRDAEATVAVGPSVQDPPIYIYIYTHTHTSVLPKLLHILCPCYHVENDFGVI